MREVRKNKGWNMTRCCPVCRSEMEKRTDEDDEWWECPNHCDTQISVEGDEDDEENDEI